MVVSKVAKEWIQQRFIRLEVDCRRLNLMIVKMNRRAFNSLNPSYQTHATEQGLKILFLANDLIQSIKRRATHVYISLCFCD
jgi:hypothetical protein